MTSPITLSLCILIPLSLKTQPPEDFGDYCRDFSLHDMPTGISNHPKGVGSVSVWLSLDIDRVRVWSTSRASERRRRPAEGYCVAWDSSVPSTFDPAALRLKDTLSIVRMIAFYRSRKRSVPVYEMVFFITKPCPHVNHFLKNSGISF